MCNGFDVISVSLSVAALLVAVAWKSSMMYYKRYKGNAYDIYNDLDKETAEFDHRVHRQSQINVGLEVYCVESLFDITLIFDSGFGTCHIFDLYGLGGLSHGR